MGKTAKYRHPSKTCKSSTVMEDQSIHLAEIHVYAKVLAWSSTRKTPGKRTLGYHPIDSISMYAKRLARRSGKKTLGKKWLRHHPFDGIGKRALFTQRYFHTHIFVTG
jgi:hypothetical protein